MKPPRARMRVEAVMRNGTRRCGAYESSAVSIGRMAAAMVDQNPERVRLREASGLKHYNITIAREDDPRSKVLYDLIGGYLDPTVGVEQAEKKWQALGKEASNAN